MAEEAGRGAAPLRCWHSSRIGAGPRALRTVRYSRLVIGEAEALVVDVRPFDVHGVGYVDVTVAYRDRTTATARLGRESVPDDLAAGEQVIARLVANMIVSIERSTT